MNEMVPLSSSDGSPSSNAFREVLPYSRPGRPLGADRLQFDHILQALLETLIGKANLLDKLPLVGQPVSNVLLSVKDSMDVSTPWPQSCLIPNLTSLG